MINFEKPILDEAKEIVVERITDHENYGEFSESMGRARLIFIGMTGKELLIEDMYKMLVALKLSRESFHHKRDNLVDACGYLQGLEDYINGVRRLKEDELPSKADYIK
ncbi:MAG: hypothetical protein CML42_00050 [Rhodobacteraceae bacterium]|nr:hypothetical protein [Paracoccaceae bacterium]|tara:strand:- start:1217 stop:1540 length:324 start_codon:yes stop_codon:yes gene_type:complete